MKKFLVVIISAFLFYINIFGNDLYVVNIAKYSISNGKERTSNPVTTFVKYKFMDFGPHEENIPEQNLEGSKPIILVAVLKMTNTDDKSMYFRSKYSNNIYAEDIKFEVLDLITGEKIELPNNSENYFQSSAMIFKSNRNYAIFFTSKKLKNTINLESALFSLDLMSEEDNAVLGSVENNLLINNYLKFEQHEENISEQELNKENELKIVGKLKFDNILDEEIYFTVDLKNNVKFSDVYLKYDDKEVKLEYDETIKKYRGKNLNLKGLKKIEVIIKNPEYLGNIEKGEVSLEINYNNSKYGEIINTIIYKTDKKMLIEKIAKLESASIGDLVKYEVIIKNSIDEKFSEVVFTDFLPKGMTLIKDSVKVSDSFIIKEISDEKANRVDIKLEVNNGHRSVETEKITYLARVNSNVKDGKNVNRVSATGETILGQVFGSNIATAEIKIDKENFYDKGIIFGRVYLDIDEDGLYQDKVDIPVSGVKVFLENGDFAISDRHGKYSIYGVEAITHTTKVYRNSLPLGLKTKNISNLQSENGESRFVDLKKAQLDRSDFALTLDGTRDLGFIKKIIEKRYEILAQDNYELNKAIEGNFLDAKSASGSGKNELPGERGLIDNGKELDIESIRNNILYENISFENKEIEQKKSIVEEWNLIPDYNLEYEITNMNNDLEIINVKDEAVVPEFMSFQVKGPGGGILKLFVNDVEVPASNVALTAKSAATDLFFLEYASVKLDSGKSKIRLAYHDMFGVERARKEINLYVRGGYEKVTLEVVDSFDDSTLKNIIVKGVDNYGFSINHSLSVNITANKGKFIIRDGVTESTATFNTNIDGYGQIGYKPNPGKNRIMFKIKADGKTNEIELDIEGDKTDFFLNGIVEGRYNFNKDRDVNFFFEKEIDSYKERFFYRGAVYAEGALEKVGYLTLTYDTNKDNEDKFFSYKNPEDYYPIFGDNSTKGYVGKSRDNLYLRVDRDRSYLLYGDYKTGELLDQRLKLGKFSRTLTGGVLRYEDDNVFLTGFIAETSNVKYTEEIKGEGVSGPYKLSRRDIVPGSETIILIVNDKSTGMVLLERKLSVGQDYTLEYDFGRLYFSEPLPSLDLEFNPITIKVSYEVQSEDGKKSTVYGAEANYKINDKVKVGVSHFKDTRETEMKEINTIHGIYENEEFLLIAEHSFTTDEFGEDGNASSLSAKYENDKIKTEITYEKSSSGYENEDSILESGIHRAQIEAEYSLEENGKLKMKTTLEERENEGGSTETRMDSYFGYESEWIKSFKYEMGVRQYIKENIEEKNQIYSLGGRITWQGVEDSKLKLFAEFEQGLEDSSQSRFAIGADYKVFEKTSVYVRHELVSNLGDFYYLDGEEDSNRTIVGIKTKHLETDIYSEYREQKDDDEVMPEIAYGVKRSFKVTDNLDLFGTFEKVSPLTKDSKEETNLTFGYDYENEKFGRLRGEFEFEIEDEFSFLNKMSYGKKMSESSYFIAKNRYYIEGNEEENRFLIGFAYRDAEDNSYHSLNKYEMNYSKNIVDNGYKKLTHILRSAHNFQDDLGFEKTVTFAVKNSNINYEGITSNYYSYLITGNLSYDIFERWTSGINLAVLFDNKKNIDYGLGLELGYIFKNNLWLSLGYNFIGFRDKDFDPTGDLNRGLYLRFRMNLGDIFDRFKDKDSGDK
ncbi:MAG: hypothetical protein ACRCW7_05665 [Cetobacterium sp.]